MSNSIQSSSAAAADEAATVICRVCGESWSKDTPGFEEAERMIYQSLGSYCPSCQFKSFNDLQEASGLNDLREVIRKEIQGLSDLRYTIIQKLSTSEQDYINGFILAYLLFAAVPVGLLKREGLEHKSNELADRYNLKGGYL